MLQTNTRFDRFHTPHIHNLKHRITDLRRAGDIVKYNFKIANNGESLHPSTLYTSWLGNLGKEQRNKEKCLSTRKCFKKTLYVARNSGKISGHGESFRPASGYKFQLPFCEGSHFNVSLGFMSDNWDSDY